MALGATRVAVEGEPQRWHKNADRDYDELKKAREAAGTAKYAPAEALYEAMQAEH